MYITKTAPSITKNGVITDKVSIQDGVLIIDAEEKFKYENGKWYCGNQGNWVWLGLLANPAYVVDGSVVIDKELFHDIFEEIVEGQQ